MKRILEMKRTLAETIELLNRLGLATLIVLVLCGAVLVWAMMTKIHADGPPKPDPLALTAEEIREAESAFRAEQSLNGENGAIGRILNEAISAPYDTEHALIIFGKLREAAANLRTVQNQRLAILERQRTKRPDCGECNYAPDLKSLVRPAKK